MRPQECPDKHPGQNTVSRSKEQTKGGIMRTRLALMMAMIVMAVSLAACGGKKENSEPAEPKQDTNVEAAADNGATTDNEVTPEPEEQTADSGSASTNKGIEVDEGLLNVEINISAESAEFYGIKFESQEEADNYAKEQGFKSVTLNDDGSVTFIMSKSKHKELMKGLNESFEQALQEMIESEQYPDIVAIEHNDNYSEFKVTTRSEELSFNESFSVMAFYMYGGMYNSFNGTEIDNVHVDFINDASGEVIESFDSKNWGESGDEGSEESQDGQ